VISIATCRGIVIAVLAVARVAPVALAQTLADDCVRNRAEAAHASDDWSSLRPSEVRVRLAPVRAAGKWSTLPDSLRRAYSLPPASLSQLSEAQRASIDAGLDSLRTDLERAELNPSKFATVKERFRLEFEAGPPTTYTLFGHSSAAPITVGDATASVQRRSVCWLSMAAQDLTRQAHAGAISEFAGALRELDREWDNFMNRGYSMLPHEVFINGYMPRSNLAPPRFQLIVVHPSVGTQIVSDSWTNLRDSHREDVLALEPIGILRYGAHHSSYRGLSWLVTFPSAHRLGSGVMVHAGRFAQVAYVMRPRDDDGKRRNALMMSVDVYRYLGTAAEVWKARKAAAIAACEDLQQDKCIEAVSP